MILYSASTTYVADPPTITTQPQELKNIVPGKPVTFTAKGTGTEPLRYHWEWNPAGEGNQWQPCGLEGVSGADSSTVTISSVQKANEGSYHCVVSNCAGSQTSKPAKLSVGKNSNFHVYVKSKTLLFLFCTYLYLQLILPELSLIHKSWRILLQVNLQCSVLKLLEMNL